MFEITRIWDIRTADQSGMTQAFDLGSALTSARIWLAKTIYHKPVKFTARPFHGSEKHLEKIMSVLARFCYWIPGELQSFTWFDKERCSKFNSRLLDDLALVPLFLLTKGQKKQNRKIASEIISLLTFRRIQKNNKKTKQNNLFYRQSIIYINCKLYWNF